jgi:hypothetical protein
MLLGAAFSPVTQPIADAAKYWNLVQVSHLYVIIALVHFVAYRGFSQRPPILKDKRKEIIFSYGK